MGLNRCLYYLTIFVINFSNISKGSSDRLMAIVITMLSILIIELALFIGSIIFRLRFNTLIKTILITGLIISLGSCFFASIYYLSNYRFKKQTMNLIPEEQLISLKAAYQAHKQMDFDKLALDSADRIKHICSKDQVEISCLIKEVSRINEILDNIFITSSEGEKLNELRTIIVNIVRAGCEEYPDTLTLFNHAERLNDLYRKVYFNPLIVEFSKILVEEGPIGYVKYITKLCKTEDGREELEQILSLPYVEILEDYLHDVEKFKLFAIELLSDIPSKIQEKISNHDIQQFIKNELPELIKTFDGRRKVIMHLIHLYKIPMVPLSVILDIFKENNGIDINKITNEQIEKRINIKIDSIILGFTKRAN